MTVSIDPKLQAFLDQLATQPEVAVDYLNAPKTTLEDWQNAEALLPVTREEFQLIEQFLADHRTQNPPS